MTTVYVESSAVLAWLLGEKRSLEVRRALDRADHVVSSVLTVVEAERSVTRLRSLAQVDEASARHARAALKKLCASWELMEISPEVRQRAGLPFPAEPVRSLDAIHLATALEFLRVYPELALLSFDDRILQNAPALGL